MLIGGVFFPKFLTLATAIALMILLSLGFWQLSRLDQKTSLIAHIDQGLNQKPVPYDKEMTIKPKADLLWRRIWLADCEVKLAPQALQTINEGRTGYRWLSVCLDTVSDRALIVDFGFSEKKIAPIFPAVIDGPINGVLRPFEDQAYLPDNDITYEGKNNLFYWRDPKAFAQLVAQDIRPKLRQDVFLQLTGAPPKLEGENLVFGTIRPTLPNRHLEYALTWFALACALMTIFLIRIWPAKKTFL